MGYHRAGFDVFGVDINPQPRYPFPFHMGDALEALGNATFMAGFDAVHASPPCQAYSVLRRANPGASYPDLIGPTREALNATGLPWIMENVPGAPLAAHSVVLCGSMFGLGSNGRQLRRHRLFESNRLLMSLQCAHKGEAIGVYGGGPTGRYTFENGAKKRGGRRGGYQGTVAEKQEALGGVDWMTAYGMNQSIPPAYTQFLGEQLLAAL